MKRARGQPPKGPKGELVSKYPPLTVRIPPITKYQLEALARMTGDPMWALVDRAVLAMIASLPADDRRLLAQFWDRRARD